MIIQERLADLRLGVVSATHCTECARLNDAADTIEKMLAVVEAAQLCIMAWDDAKWPPSGPLRKALKALDD